MKTLWLPMLGSAGAAALAACTPSNDQGSTMALLHAGDSKVCTASDVQETLRELLRPKGADTSGYQISVFDQTLQGFDKVVSKADCRAHLKIDGPRGEVVATTSIDFTVLPSAENPQSFVVSADIDALRTRLQEQITDDAQNKADQQTTQAEQSRLVALVKPGWLMGRWVTADQGSNACLNGPYIEFDRGHVLRGPHVTGTWQLTGTDLQMVTAQQAATMSISDADDIRFQLSSAEGPGDAYRRCTQADAAQAQADEIGTSGSDPAETAPEPSATSTTTDPGQSGGDGL